MPVFAIFEFLFVENSMNFSGNLRLLVFISLFLLPLTVIYSQNPYKPGEHLANIGAGYGFYGTTGDVSTPPISAGLQFVITPEVSLGGLFAFTSSRYNSDILFNSGESGYVSGTYTYYMAGMRAEYHFIEDSVNYDGYCGATIGYSFVSFSQPINPYSSLYSPKESYAFFGIHGGIRYYFKPNLAFFGEVGYGVGYITLGITYKWD